jgi:photosystem II stability/assembly factor-like uncharacterized protein
MTEGMETIATESDWTPVRDTVLRSLAYRLIGPHRGGRVVAVAGDVSDPMTFYFGACAGGVWKTIDGGTTWRNVSDGFFRTAAVGAIAVSPSDPNVIYVGTGEACIRNNVSHGDGVYKSTDGGRSWTNVGLRDTRHIGRIQIHPTNPDIVYVAALGHAWGPNPERGVFRSTDGGRSWQKVLYKSERAGSHDIAMDPNNPRILFAAIWQAQRYPHALWSGGPECGLWRTLDGGDTWEDITRKPGLPRGLLGKIGVAVSPACPGRVWAVIEAEDGAVFRSDDYGETWTRLSEQSLLRTRPWYYMHITADPKDPDTVYVQNYSFWRSIDGGATFHRLPSPHGDEHALWIDPNHPRRMIKGNDGGACVTFNSGVSWSSIYNQPTAQIYHVTTDDQVPYRVYGSQQDNTAISLPSMSVDGAIHERDWYAPGGGESGYIAIKPDDPNIVVASGPAGRRAYNDIMTLYDHRTRQKWNITVWPELYGWGVGAGELKYRLQWTFPILFSRHDPKVLYVAGNRLFRSTDLGASWEVISPDLTRNDPSKLGPSGGPITRDNTGAEVYCTIFALAESPHRPGLLWAGTDDGLIHISEDGGHTWRNITPPAQMLPEWALISIIEPSPHDPATAYVAATRYKHDDTRPYLLKTNDYGRTWSLITDGIPADDFTRVVREDPNRRGLLYAGTETGIYVSFDDGGHWHRMGGNLPVVPIHDFVIKGVELVVATHGRSFWILDDLTPLHQLHDGLAGDRVHLFQPRPRPRIRVYGGIWGEPVAGRVHYGAVDTSRFAALAVRRQDGAMDWEFLDAGQNPPNGIVIRYYLPAACPSGASLAILDAAGGELRRFDGLPARAGMNSFLWNMRLPGAPPVEADDLEPWHRPDGPLVLPGTYQAKLVVAGQTLQQSFTIEPDPRLRTSRADLELQHDFLLQILDRLSLVNRTINRIDSLRGQLRPWLEVPVAREAAGRALAELDAVRGRLIDVHMKESQVWPSGLHEKFNALFSSVDSADYAPPQQARDVFAKLCGELEDLLARYERIVAGPIQDVNAAVAAAGLPAVRIAD